MQVLVAQNGIFIPRKPGGGRPTAAEIASPVKFEVIVSFEEGTSRYALDAIDILDSAYNIGFSNKNPRFYKITITGFDDGKELTENNNTLAKDRTEAVYHYFTSRSKAEFMIRIAPSTYMHSCLGEQQEMLRYRVPVDFKWVSLYGKPEKETKYTQKISLFGKVLVTFEEDMEACVGKFNNCYIPRRDTIIRTPYSTTILSKGCFQQIIGTKDDCITDLDFTVEEHLDYKPIIENYFLIPHKKQILVQAGYIILRSNRTLKYGECKQPLPDSIFVRFATREEQTENDIRIIGKTYSEKGGIEYKPLRTKKIRSKVTVGIEAAINAAQVDTIFIGKRIQEEELSKYFYPAKSGEPGVFEVDGDYYKAYKLNKYGEYVMKKPFEALFRNTQEEETPQDMDMEEEEE